MSIMCQTLEMKVSKKMWSLPFKSFQSNWEKRYKIRNNIYILLYIYNIQTMKKTPWKQDLAWGGSRIPLVVTNELKLA